MMFKNIVDKIGVFYFGLNALAKIEGNSLPHVSRPFQVISVAHVLLLKSKLYFLGGAQQPSPVRLRMRSAVPPVRF